MCLNPEIVANFVPRNAPFLVRICYNSIKRCNILLTNFGLGANINPTRLGLTNWMFLSFAKIIGCSLEVKSINSATKALDAIMALGMFAFKF